jgi:secernin
MCDTLAALPSATADGSVIFAKNSDRPVGEAQSIRHYARESHPGAAMVRCTYIEIPQIETTAAVVLSQPDWMWGAEMGANEHGVVIGNEAVWTQAPLGPPALLGMDLVRLGLERAQTAAEAVEVITALLEEFGQGGACSENDSSFAYHNSFLLADAREAWVVETADMEWVAERVISGTRNISNGLSIRTEYEKSSKNLVEKDLDFAAYFSADSVQLDPSSRESWGRRLMTEHMGEITPDTMMNILSHHDSGICMHGAFATTASMVSRLTVDGTNEHWMTGAPYPCKTPFKLVPVAI